MAVRIESQAEPIPGYKLVERLGGGGFGEVWKAIAPGGLPKAIKFVYGDLQAASGNEVRAEQELKALSRVKTVRHPYILSLERYDIIDGQLLIVMELADRNLWDRFKECRLQGLPGIPRDELLRYMQETSEALDLMNVDYQLQHLDIKPQNLFLVHQHAKVADFGLVKDLHGRMASVTGGITPVYAAPETFDGWISRYCDQYSLAIVYQELLTGQRPFNGTTVGQLIMQHLRSAPNLASLPAGDREVIGRALSKNPDERFPRCLDFVQALWGGERTPAMPARPIPQEPGPAAPLTDHQSSGETLTAEPGELPEEDEELHHTQRHRVVPSPSNAENARWIRVNEISGLKAGEEPSAPPVAPQVQSDGVLFPSLVIGLGNTGLTVLQRLRNTFQEAFGGIETLPNIRWLYMDTDPEALQHAERSKSGARITTPEILHTRLNRPSHYLRTHPGRPRLESWFDTKMLYRIPRSRVTTGLRILGRLAFFDNYRAIAVRLNKELDACMDPEVLDRVAQLPGLGLRSVRPRVYVITSLAGGTGGGMFLDLAYLLRKLLKARGYESPDVVGLFVLPAADRSSEHTMPLANTFAALTELNHFSAPDTNFWAHYDEREPPLRDNEAPYSRSILLPLPAGTDETPLRLRASLIADWLYHDLATPLGRTADECRVDTSAPAAPSWSLPCQTFGMFRISWPRLAFLRSVGSNLCQQLIRSWMEKDATAVRAPVKAVVDAEWSRLGLDGDSLLTTLQQTGEKVIGDSPERAFAQLLEPLTDLDPRGTDLAPAARVMDRLAQLLGRPGEGIGAPPGSLAEPLDQATNALSSDLAEKLTTFVTSLIEQSSVRLAGAEEAVRQAIVLIEQELRKHEQLGQELRARVENAYARIQSILEAYLYDSTGKNRRGSAPVSTLVELLQGYPTWQYQSLLFQRLHNVFVSLRGGLSDQLRELNYCRTRLVELLSNFQDPFAQSQAEEGSRWNRFVFPAGCRNLADATKQMLERITPEELHELDGLMQKQLQRQFQGLMYVCLASANLLVNVQQTMQQEAETFVHARLAGIGVADMYLEHHAGEEEALKDLDAGFQEATPDYSSAAGGSGQEIRILAAPRSPVGERFRDLARQALPDVEFVPAAGTDDILIYREIPHLRLAEVAQLGPLAYDAYRQLIALKNLTPHSRTDIYEWRAAGG